MALEPRFVRGTWETAPAPGEQQTMELVFVSSENSLPEDPNTCGTDGRPLKATVYSSGLSDSLFFETRMCLERSGESSLTGSFKSPETTGRYDISVRFTDADGGFAGLFGDVGFIEVQEPNPTQPVSASVSCQGVSDVGDAIEVTMVVDPDGRGVARVPVSVGGQQVWEQRVQTEGSQTTTTALIPKGLIPQGANQPVEIPTQV